MRNGSNISKVASELLQAYQELQRREQAVSPRYEKTAINKAIEEQIEEENQLDSPRDDEEEYRREIAQLRDMVERMKQKYSNNVSERQPLCPTNKPPPKKTQVLITQYQSDFLRQQYGKLK